METTATARITLAELQAAQERKRRRDIDWAMAQNAPNLNQTCREIASRLSELGHDVNLTELIYVVDSAMRAQLKKG